MLFSSDVFVIAFLPLFLIGFAAVRKAWRPGLNYFVLLASLAFYAFWDARLLPIILISMVANYALAAWLVSAATRKTALIAGVVFNLGYLFAFKYACFAGLTQLSFWPADVGACGEALPLGISFFTFQQLAYLIDLHRGSAPRRLPTFAGFGAFVTFFPHLIAGPITRHNELLEPIEEKRYTLSARSLELGLAVFAVGFFKKVFLADPLAHLANPIFEASKTGTLDAATALIGVVSFSGQIYFDFSGYSDMAVGLALMVGIVLPWNFARPYAAASIIDFWRRWHITLSSWLRDYLYISLGGNRRGQVRRYINLFITMLLGGLWHGAAWTFVVWGALHGVYLAINHALRDVKIVLPMPVFLKIIATNAAVMVAWVFFRAEGFESAMNMFGSLRNLGFDRVTPQMFVGFVAYIPFLSDHLDPLVMHPNQLVATFGSIAAAGYLLAGLIDTQRIAGRHERWIDADDQLARTACMVCAALVLVLGFFIQGGGAASFIYFDF